MRQSKQEQVWEACDLLIANGIAVDQITAKLVQQHLVLHGYKAGSLRDIYLYRKGWLQQMTCKIGASSVGKHVDINHVKPVDSRVLELKRQNNQQKQQLEELQFKYQQILEQCHALSIKQAEIVPAIELLHLEQQRVHDLQLHVQDLQYELKKSQLTSSKVKQLMENQRHEFLIQIDALKVENKKLRSGMIDIRDKDF